MPLPDAAPVLLSGSRRVKSLLKPNDAVRVDLVLAVELVGAELAADLREVPAHRLRDVAVDRVGVVLRLPERPREHALVAADVDLRERRPGQLVRAR